jgi:hypothetical protein
MWKCVDEGRGVRDGVKAHATSISNKLYMSTNITNYYWKRERKKSLHSDGQVFHLFLHLHIFTFIIEIHTIERLIDWLEEIQYVIPPPPKKNPKRISVITNVRPYYSGFLIKLHCSMKRNIKEYSGGFLWTYELCSSSQMAKQIPNTKQKYNVLSIKRKENLNTFCPFKVSITLQWFIYILRRIPVMFNKA